MKSARKLRVWGGTRQTGTGGASPRAGLVGGDVETATVTRLATRRPTRAADDARYGRLFEKFRRPAKNMVRSAFGSAFSDDELDDFYSSAWLSTLAAFERNPRKLADDELRRYVMTAVANQASRELRRRGRKPTVPLDVAPETSDGRTTPDEAAARREYASLTREVLGSLSPRRRAVLVYRYGWDLEPSEVCNLVEGLSPRAYRKEIERGVAEVARKMRLIEDGGWCETREPLLRAVVAGTADDDERRQASQHLSNCRRCASFVESLNGHLHELGGGMAVAALASGGGVETVPILDRVTAGVDRAKQAVSSALGRGGDGAEQASQLVSSGGTRGAGAAGAGAIAKLAGLGAMPKIAAACLGTGAAATACIAAGIVPGAKEDPAPPRETAKVERATKPDLSDAKRHAALIALQETPPPTESAPPPDPPPPAGDPPTAPEPAPPPPPEPTPAEAPAPEPAPTVQEFEPIGTPVGSPASAGGSGGSSGGGPSAGGGDFGP